MRRDRSAIGTLVERTGKVGGFAIAQANVTRGGGISIVGRVAR